MRSVIHSPKFLFIYIIFSFLLRASTPSLYLLLFQAIDPKPYLLSISNARAIQAFHPRKADESPLATPKKVPVPRHVPIRTPMDETKTSLHLYKLIRYLFFRSIFILFVYWFGY